MKHADWAKEYMCDVHFRANGGTGGWTVKSMVGGSGCAITTEHAGEIPPSMDEVVEAIWKQIRPDNSV